MPPRPEKQRPVKVDQRGAMLALQALEEKSDDELKAETRFKAQAQAILGQRAAQRYDAKAARVHFQKALAAARPQERLQLRRMADAALAIAERRPDDLRAAAAKLGVDAPGGWQMFGLRMMGLIAPPASAGTLARVRGIVVGLLLIVGFLVVFFGGGFGLVSLICLASGHVALDDRIFYGLAVGVVAIVGFVLFIRRRSRAAQEKAQAKQQDALAARGLR